MLFRRTWNWSLLVLLQATAQLGLLAGPTMAVPRGRSAYGVTISAAMFGRNLGEYVRFERWILIAIVVVFALRLGLSLAGVPNNNHPGTRDWAKQHLYGRR